MKIKTFYLLLFLPTLLFGQKTSHFDHLDSKWNVAKTYTAGNQQNPNFVATRTTIYGYQGDTLINNEKWFKLYATNDSLFQKNLVYQGLTKAENNRVLYLNETYHLDTLYDFNLNIGDSVLFNLNGIYPEKIPVTAIDSMQLNGGYYKRFKFAEPILNAFDELNEVWIEGIGSIHGPLFPNFPRKFSQEMPDAELLTCTYSDNQQVWENKSYPSCYINIMLGIERQEVWNFKIYPNPCNNQLFISTSEQILSIDIYNINGLKTFSSGENNGSICLDISGLKQGLYFLRIKTKNNFYVKKIIKN